MASPTARGPDREPRTGRVHRLRFAAVAALLTLGFAVLASRLFVIQIVDHEKHLRAAKKLRRGSDALLAYRGDIHLADGVLVARDIVEHEVGLDPRRLSPEKVQQVVRLISDALGKPAEHRRERLLKALEKKEKGGSYILLAHGMSEALLAEVRGALERLLAPGEMKAFIAEPRPRRTYPRGTLAASVVGVTDQDGGGVEGIEKSMGAYLSPQDGRREVVKDGPQKTRIFTLDSVEVAPVGGYDVYLTIDSVLQAIVEEELALGVRREKAESGLFVLMDPNTGDVLAMASYPTYDPNRFSEYPGVERKKRRQNKVIESLYEPGSVIKIFYAAHALGEGIAERGQLMRTLVGGSMSWDGGRFARVGRRVIEDVRVHEDLTLEDSVIFSSNIGMSILGLRLGKAGILDVLSRFGLDRPTGIALPAEARWEPWGTPRRRWNPLMSPVSASFGYEVMVTPLQLCRAFAAVVNGGYLLKPRIIERLARDDDLRAFPRREVEGRPISEETSRSMREILRLVVEEGTAKWLKIEGFEFGGKTGTARMAKGGYRREDYLASFEGFAPFENPRVVALCMIEKPTATSYYGGMVAGPIVAEVFRRMFHVRNPTKLTIINKVARN